MMRYNTITVRHSGDLGEIEHENLDQSKLERKKTLWLKIAHKIADTISGISVNVSRRVFE